MKSAIASAGSAIRSSPPSMIRSRAGSTSNALVYKYAQSAHTAQILLGVPEVSITVEHGCVTGVTTPNGKIAAPNVVIAAGSNARTIGRTAGVELPLIAASAPELHDGLAARRVPRRRADDHRLSAVSACPTGSANGAIFGWEYTWHNKNVAPAYGTNAAHDAIIDPVESVKALKDPRFPSLALVLLARQFGHIEGEGFADSRYLRGISHNIGYYVYRDATAAYRTSADGMRQPYDSERAIIDAHPDIEGLFVSVAHVGHGIMSSPAGGEILARKVLGLPLAEPEYADFAFDASWVEYDEGVL